MMVKSNILRWICFWGLPIFIATPPLLQLRHPCLVFSQQLLTVKMTMMVTAKMMILTKTRASNTARSPPDTILIIKNHRGRRNKTKDLRLLCLIKIGLFRLMLGY